MPAGDGTGPVGLGPMTGRGAGYCVGFPFPGYMNAMGGWAVDPRAFQGGYLPCAYGPATGPYGYPPAYPAAWQGGLGWFGRGFGRGWGRRFGRGRGWGRRWAGW
ncbi:MAG: DUF5320 domain-containing protein [Phycisphaerae bacterium]|nr:DUF5320 domain-containing protein [Phycisphaerae bacterium]